MIEHHFTVDVEEYFQVSALEPFVARESWEARDARLCIGMDRLLGLLDDAGARATFFVLGWVAERYPGLARRLADAGHEVASHGYGHRRVSTLDRGEFRESVRRAKAILEDQAGRPVLGYRAPTFSILPGGEWALDVLLEEGYRYDSSLFPVPRPGYGYSARAPRDPHWIERDAGKLLEVPPTTLRRFGTNLPAAGGAYLRLFPYALTRLAITEAAEREAPATLYVHPWELDTEQPRLDVPWSVRLRHYGGLQRVADRLGRVLREFRFRPVAATLAELTAA
ncbi:MAG TPA: XrtA system polysaccharide deacetylase [Longimicrobiales bacterium]|nr:XrtA system polysaccharide deacetylase [Longimicrobiales bacterium]